MSDLQRYIENRLVRDPEFAEEFEEGYTDFKVGVLLRQAREAAGVTQEEMASRLKRPRSAISKVENHTEKAPVPSVGNGGFFVRLTAHGWLF